MQEKEAAESRYRQADPDTNLGKGHGEWEWFPREQPGRWEEMVGKSRGCWQAAWCGSMAGEARGTQLCKRQGKGDREGDTERGRGVVHTKGLNVETGCPFSSTFLPAEATTKRLQNETKKQNEIIDQIGDGLDELMEGAKVGDVGDGWGVSRRGPRPLLASHSHTHTHTFNQFLYPQTINEELTRQQKIVEKLDEQTGNAQGRILEMNQKSQLRKVRAPCVRVRRAGEEEWSLVDSGLPLL
jgi:hypothetical protein